MGHTITIFASGNTAKMKWIQKGEVDKVVSYIRERISSQGPELSPHFKAIIATSEYAKNLLKYGMFHHYLVEFSQDWASHVSRSTYGHATMTMVGRNARMLHLG